MEILLSYGKIITVTGGDQITVQYSKILLTRELKRELRRVGRSENQGRRERVAFAFGGSNDEGLFLQARKVDSFEAVVETCRDGEEA